VGGTGRRPNSGRRRVVNPFERHAEIRRPAPQANQRRSTVSHSVRNASAVPPTAHRPDHRRPPGNRCPLTSDRICRTFTSESRLSPSCRGEKFVSDVWRSVAPGAGDDPLQSQFPRQFLEMPASLIRWPAGELIAVCIVQPDKHAIGESNRPAVFGKHVERCFGFIAPQRNRNLFHCPILPADGRYRRIIRHDPAHGRRGGYSSRPVNAMNRRQASFCFGFGE